MSSSNLYLLDKDFCLLEDQEYHNSWLFTPIALDALFEKYLPEFTKNFFGDKQSFITATMSNNTLSGKLNDKLNNSSNTADRILWELGNQQIFFSKDKQIISDSIKRFLVDNQRYEKSLSAEHIIERFNEIADDILNIDEKEFPNFVFKNTSVDDGVIRWFKYDEDTETYKSLQDCNKYVTEFVFIQDGSIVNFQSNLTYFGK